MLKYRGGALAEKPVSTIINQSYESFSQGKGLKFHSLYVYSIL